MHKNQACHLEVGPGGQQKVIASYPVLFPPAVTLGGAGVEKLMPCAVNPDERKRGSLKFRRRNLGLNA